MLPGGHPRVVCVIYSSTCFLGLDLCCADPSHPLTAAGEELDHLSDL